MPEKSPDTVVLREELLYLARRARSPFWQIHLKSKTLKKWLRKSTGTENLDEAKQLAEDWAADLRADERRGYPLISKKFKAVADIVSKQLKEQIANGTGKKIFADYHRAIDQYLIPFFGNHNIDRITPALITEFHQWRKEKVGRQLKQSTQHTHNLALTKVLDLAVEHGYMMGFQRPELKNTGETGEARGHFTQEELARLIQFLIDWAAQGRTQSTRNLRELLVLYVLFVANTGVRPGTETKGIRWKHIELIKNVEEPYVHIFLPEGKTGSRPIVARYEIWSVLERLKGLQSDYDQLTLEELLAKKDEGLVFRMRSGKQPFSLVNAFGDAIREAGMLTNGRDDKERSLYSLRHYYATERISEGFTYEELEKQMGTSSDMLRDHYNHMDIKVIASRLSGGRINVEKLSIETLKDVNPARAHMMGLIAAGTGLYLPLAEQNPQATKDISQALSQIQRSRH
jgi:hypothetical protein